MSRQKPNIILWDLETLTNLSEAMKVFTRLGDYPGKTLKASINSIICFGYKRLGEDKAHCINAWDFKERWESDVNDDYEIVKAAYHILKDADAIVTHNGKRFDYKFLNSRIVYHRNKKGGDKSLYPLTKVPHIDTCAVARKELFLFSNRLNDLAKHLNCAQKLENGGWELWVKVLSRHKPSMRLMTKYCKQDVQVLEEVFIKLRGMVKLPNQRLFGADISSCPQCGENKLIKYGSVYTNSKVYQRLRCKGCSALVRGELR